MAQLLPMSEDMMASLGMTRMIARQAWRCLARALVPGGALVVQLVVQALQFRCPGCLLLLHQGRALRPAAPSFRTTGLSAEKKDVHGLKAGQRQRSS